MPAGDLNSVLPPGFATAAGGSSDNQEGIVAKQKPKAAGVSVICPGWRNLPHVRRAQRGRPHRCMAAIPMMEMPNDRP